MSKITDDAPIIWGSDESPVKGKTYSFEIPIRAKSSPVKITRKNRDNKDRIFLTGKFICEDKGKLNFVGHKVIGQRKDPIKGNIFYKRSKRKYYFNLPKDFTFPKVG